MTQPAKQPIVANPATPRDGNTTLNTVVTRPGAKIGKPAREETQADVAVTPAQAILLGQITGEPQRAAAAQTTEACPVNEPGVADPCGVAGAADAHQAAAGGLWALAALPLLGLGGGGAVVLHRRLSRLPQVLVATLTILSLSRMTTIPYLQISTPTGLVQPLQ